MSYKCLLVLATSVGLSGLCAASASADTLYLNNVSPSSNMTVTFPGLSPQTTPYVGRINWTFDRSNPDNAALDTLVSGSNLTTFCIEGTQDVYLNQNATFGSILTSLASAPQDNVGSHYQMGTNAVTLAKFWDAHYSDSALNSVNAAAFQLGVWEIVYDGGTGLNLGAGTFQASAVAGDATSSNAYSQAQSWLAGLPSVTPTEHYQLYILSDPRLQDQLFGVPAVPLPAALPAGLVGLAGLVAVRYLRKKAISA